MSKKAGALLWNRMRVTLSASVTTDVDTGLTQPNRSFPDYSPGEPPLGVSAAVSPPPGTLPASRVHVIPLAPTNAWAVVTHGEPYFNTVTGTIHVLFDIAAGAPTINVLFWDPHSMVGPGQAVPYS
jgi:hypothetical protein